MLSKLRVKYKKTFALGVFILLCLFGIALANLTSHTEALVDALLLALDSDADGAINDETWYGSLVTNGDSHDHSGGDGAQIDHGGLAGLTDDDHNGIYYSEAEVDAALALKIDIGVDPDIDVLYGWDDSAGAVVHITIGTGLSLTGTTLTATASATAMDDIAVPDAALSLNLGAYQHLWDTNVDTSAFRVGIDASYFEVVNSGGSDVIVRLVGSNITANLGTFTVSTDSTHARTGTTADDDMYLDAYDVDGTAYVHMMTLKAGNEPYLYLGPQTVGWRVDQNGDVTAADGAGITLSDDNHIALDATADGMDDDEYNGSVITGRNCGETLTQWDLVRLANDADPWHQADANAAGEFPAIGLSVAACTDTNGATILTRGIVRNEGWTGLTPGGAVYLSTTAGGLTQTAPSTSGDAVQIVGWALSDSEIYFDFSRPYSKVQ